MANKKGMHVCLLATLPAPGLYSLNHLLNPAPGGSLHNVYSPTPHAAATLPTNSRSDPHGGDLCYLKITSMHSLDLGGRKTGKPGPNTLSASTNRMDRGGKEFICTVPFAQPASA
ncbi:hypothetical protein [Pseudomonas sp. NFX224]|uniref:hypothetical protein n=1 Tax=Pseudomonas sp. NFX224 TaxID=3402862 RepID=UPI003AFA1125